MKPTEHKQETHEELIAHIRKNLKSHEEPYNLGAWESFEEKNNTKKTPIFWITRLGGVAAVIAVCFTLFLLARNNSEKVEHIVVKVNSDQNNLKLETPIDTKRNNQTEIDINQSIVQPKALAFSKSGNFDSKIVNSVPKSTDIVALTENVIANNQQLDQSSSQTQNTEIIDKKLANGLAVVNEEKTNSSTSEFLNLESKRNESKAELQIKSNAKSKWVLGIMVAPSIGNTEELNMGYGVSMGYKFSNKLSLVTGVSYNEMSASKDFSGNVGMSSILFGNNKSLAAISQKVSGLDIPLELKYSFNNSVYASLGVSAFAVIGQSRSNTFIQGVVVNRSVNKSSSSSDISSGNAIISNGQDASSSKGQFANTYIVNKKIVETANLEEKNNVNYLGFYNFSIGYKKKMLKNHYVAFEPFLKLPIREVTQDNLRLVGAGLRLKVDF